MQKLLVVVVLAALLLGLQVRRVDAAGRGNACARGALAARLRCMRRSIKIFDSNPHNTRLQPVAHGACPAGSTWGVCKTPPSQRLAEPTDAAPQTPPPPSSPSPPSSPPPPREVPLPYALQDKPHPRVYAAPRAPVPPTLDGATDDDAAWRAAPWSEAFVDIVGPTGPAPPPGAGAARVKMAWDADALYVAARLEDAALFANETRHDSVIYNDNDFEIFLDPDGDNWHYIEFEINALGATWDLLLARPYRNGGPALMSWEAAPPALDTQRTGPTGWAPARHAVRVEGGAVNTEKGTRAWQVEVALPWSLLRQAAGGRRVPPRDGDAWRINFSR